MQAILYQAENDTVHFVEKKELNSEYHFKYSLKEDNQHSPKMFVIEGNIGVGKTTLARSLAKKMRCKPFLEPALENPFLERFYDDPHKYAMKLQMWIFRQRYRTYLEAVKYMKATGNGVILDRSVFSDYVFARVGFSQGFINQADFSQYQSLRQKVLCSIPKPYCIIYLAASPEQCSERLLKRGRECESTIPLDYLQSLDREYSLLLESFKNEGTNVVQLDWSQFGGAEDVMKKTTAVKNPTPWTSDDYDRVYIHEKELLSLLNKASEDVDHRT